jgi:ferredoxin like protein
MTQKNTLAERLGTVAYRNQNRSAATPHITVDTSICNGICPHKCTTRLCPAGCYSLDDDSRLRFRFEDCIECGVCLYACDQGAVQWRFPHPESGRGVNWSLG